MKNDSRKDPVSAHTQRIASIDILRALTMMLMIFVNDLWTLKDTPSWLGHVERGVDGIGLADVVFPAFLFIVGLSLPYAVANRRKKGENEWQLVKHVLLRSLALIIMGVFLVNGETYNAEATGMTRALWNPLCCLAFILIWNSYPSSANKYFVITSRVAGITALIVLGIIYRGGAEGNIQRFSTQWWGILGLIGWSYLASGLITVFAKDRFFVILGGWIFFCLLSIISKAGLLPQNAVLDAVPSAIRGGTLAGLTMGGVLTSVVFRHFVGQKNNLGLTLVLTIFSALLIALSAITRPYWGLAKLGATPAWLFLCSAFTIIAFIVIYWIVDVHSKSSWFTIIKPAGTATLLCYLVPYFAYSVRSLLKLRLPEVFITDGIGLLKSILFVLLCVMITGALIRLGIRLRI